MSMCESSSLASNIRDTLYLFKTMICTLNSIPIPDTEAHMARRRKPEQGALLQPDQVEMTRRVRLAGEELDARPGGRLGWLLEFARTPVTKLPEQAALDGVRLLAC